jgi:hypothetical protein
MSLNIARLRRMIAEPTDATYTDADLEGIAERHVITDADGNESTDYNSAAAEIWGEKAACLAGAFGYSGDGGNLSRSQVFDHCRKMAAYFKSRGGLRLMRVVRDETQIPRWDDDLTVGEGNE